MSILETITSPADLSTLSEEQLATLSEEIRHFLVQHVAATGGHLGPNLGVVELTIALHRVFNSPRDPLIFDTGHQSYVHKILTGRHDFDHLRQAGGLSGYPSRAESEHDVVENSHASTAISWADGVARGFQLSGSTNHAVAIIGDGAMTGGMAWEALNNVAEDPNRPVVIVLNDNGRSYSPTVGGVIRSLDPARKLDSMRVSKNYESFLNWGKRTLQAGGLPGQLTYGALRGFKRGMKEMLVDAGIFDTLGLKYIGPVDGHNIGELEEALTMARDFGGPVVVHAITEKGRGYKPAETNEDDRFHAIGKIHPETGLPIAPSRFGWTSVFADELASIAKENPRVVGVTAAMMNPVGLKPLKEAFPQRVIDVGIAEAHAMTMSAGLAHAGYHPVLALYSTFMNRGFDQLLMDVALHGENVTISLDRSGVTGDDGPSHNGMWDLSLAAMIPGLKVAVPRDEATLRAELRTAVASEGPTLLRYPKGAMPPALPAVRTIGTIEILLDSDDPRPLVLVGVGALAHTMMDAAGSIDAPVVVVDPTWVLPVPTELAQLIASSRGAVILEDGLIDGGIGSEIARSVREAGSDVRIETLGISKEFLLHAARKDILTAQGMDAAAVVEAARRMLN
ncbi:1-deoxy-D-xylulose-5-phosphate synthase [Arcanobacterium wilhelmae]|uniref:1-deoxy-D-xylulose-5-phosphate synthase n=1 Tax=Arcanobacterium wilhelmae TaxID=1803177 RepID=A0ABT9N9D7_9ACTO|nr:1-deoxy-D-xylulose-5-phosphate synthase [Arcanobacterium wilhelmae]MDP9800148.1 1-deoxy-D-xylulose-5-phosphate synthase [Arcanobacterium wilhelmae]WFN89588.1 1-deoxy-D-xylulose-5-phosphate synthase [Arcanobacterium wilhelmae]